MRLRLGIQGKLVGTLVLAGLFPLLLSLAALMVSLYRMRLLNVGQTFQAAALQDADNLATHIATQVELAQVIANLPSMAELLRAADAVPPLPPMRVAEIEMSWPQLKETDEPLRSVLTNHVAAQWRSVREKRLRFAEMLVADASGRLIAATNRTSDYYQADEAWWEEARDARPGEVLLEDARWDPSALSADGEPGLYVLDVVLPLHDAAAGAGADARFLGAMKISLDVGWAVAHLQTLVRPADTDARVWLVHSTGVPVRASSPATLPSAGDASDADRDSVGPVLEPKVVQRLRVRRSGYVVDPDLNDDVVGFAAITLPEARATVRHNLDWFVVVAATRDDALAPVRRLMWLILAAGLLTIVACFVSGLFIARREIIRPLLALRKGAAELGSGNINFRLPVGDDAAAGGPFRHDDEIGQLALEFNRMADRLRATLHRLEQAGLVKQQFIDVASHELRTPVTYILGVAQLAERQQQKQRQAQVASTPPSGAGEGGGGGGGEEPALASKIAAKARRLARIVDNMMKLLQDGSFDTSLQLGMVDVRAVLESTRLELLPFINERGQRCVIAVAADVPPIRADAEKLKDVMLNLLGNAVRFSPDESTVRVDARRATDYIEVDVRDQGSGIAAEDLPHLFDPFRPQNRERVMRHSSGDYAYGTRGLGLGLSVVKRFVDLHGGSVAVETSTNGTRMRVRLPIHSVETSGGTSHGADKAAEAKAAAN